MRTHRWVTLALPLGVVAGALVACKKEPPPPPPAETAAPAPPPPTPFAVKDIEVGKGLTPEKQITTPTSTFGVRDTIYVSVVIQGEAPRKVISAHWTYQTGQKVQEQSDTIVPTGPATTEFHITKKTPWPAGRYTVEILVDGSAAGTKDFEVKK